VSSVLLKCGYAKFVESRIWIRKGIRNFLAGIRICGPDTQFFGPDTQFLARVRNFFWPGYAIFWFVYAIFGPDTLRRISDMGNFRVNLVNGYGYAMWLFFTTMGVDRIYGLILTISDTRASSSWVFQNFGLRPRIIQDLDFFSFAIVS